MSAKDETAAETGWSDFEKAAMKERAKELKSARGRGKKDPEAEMPATVAAMPKTDRVLAERIHALVKANAPELTAKLRYGMPTYYRDGKVVCFLQVASKYDTRYSSFGFEDNAGIDEGTMWPVGFGIKELTAADEEILAALIRKAAG